ncbi:hypothetical protein ACPZ19_13120 [Amycolatopsis lurida]
MSTTPPHVPAGTEPASTVLKVLLRQRHLQSHGAFSREYKKVAAKIDPSLASNCPSKAQFYRWQSGELVTIPYADHCIVLEAMLPGWKVDQLFEPYDGSGVDFVPAPESDDVDTSEATEDLNVPDEFVALYPHRADTPDELWTNLLLKANHSIDLFANASLFLPEGNPQAIDILRDKARNGTHIRILLGDPETSAMRLRAEEERLHAGLIGRIRMALAYYSPLVGEDGIEFRLHGTALYNSIFRYDDEMLVNQHAYGTYGYIAPILHLKRSPSGDLFDTYMKSFSLVWEEESRAVVDPAELRD